MKLSTGKVAFKMEFDNGETGTIYINPNDRTIQERIKSFEKNVEEKVRQIDMDKYEKRLGDGLSVDITDIDAIFNLSAENLENLNEKMQVLNDIEKAYNDIVKKEFDEIFKSPVSEVAFKYCEPFDTIVYEENEEEKREIYIMQVLKWLGYELKAYAEKNSSAMDKHIAKYTRK
jgi:hypothetical protein